MLQAGPEPARVIGLLDGCLRARESNGPSSVIDVGADG